MQRLGEDLIDRIAFGEVTDCLLVYHRGWYWPAFNVADSFITVGVGILVVHSLFVGDAPAADPTPGS